MSVNLKLRKPVTLNNGAVTAELNFRRPTGRDLATCGYPVRTGRDGVTDINPAAVGKLIAVLTNNLPVVVDAMDVLDWNAAMAVVLDFFGDGVNPMNSGTDTSSAPDSGALSTTS